MLHVYTMCMAVNDDDLMPIKFMLCYVMLCYVMLCYAMLCYAMLCYAMLCYVMLCYVMLCYVMLCYVIEQKEGGTQLKLIITFSDEGQALFKPMR